MTIGCVHTLRLNVAAAVGDTSAACCTASSAGYVADVTGQLQRSGRHCQPVCCGMTSAALTADTMRYDCAVCVLKISSKQ